jgi:hypothetical protein
MLGPPCELEVYVGAEFRMPQSQCSGSCGQAGGGLATALIGLACLSVALMGTGCGVDDRNLSSEGASAGGSNVAGASGASNDATAGESGFEDRAALPRCFYLGTSVQSGCETLVKNAGFGSNVASWVAEPAGITEGWFDADASDAHNSGSMVVMNLNYKADPEAANGVNGGGARQCVPASAGTTYELAADVFIPADQGAGFQDVSYTSVATLSVFYYEGAGCVGRTLTNFTSDPVDQTDEWVHVEGRTTAPKESQSMAVRLATLKPFRQIMFEAHFDNVLVRESPAP